MQHLQRGVADGATMPARLVRAAVEVAGPVPEAHGRLLRHRLEADGVVVLSDHTGQGARRFMLPCIKEPHKVPSPGNQWGLEGGTCHHSN